MTQNVPFEDRANAKKAWLDFKSRKGIGNYKFQRVDSLESMDDCVLLKKFLEINHVGTLIDLEDRKLETLKYFYDNTDMVNILYLEIDATYIYDD